MIRSNVIAITIAMLTSSVCFGQFAEPPINDQWVRPITFEVTEAVGSGVRAEPTPIPETHSNKYVSYGSAIQNHGASQKVGKAAYPYTWTTRMGMLFMDRDNHNAAYLEDTAAGNAPYYASEMGATIGFKGSVIRHHEGQRDREFGFMGMFSDSALNFSVIDDDFDVLTNPNISIIGDGVALNSYNSSVIGMEYNFRQRYDNFTGIAGFRWINLTEDFLYTITAPGGPQVIGGQTETSNNLLGFQLGGEGTIFRRGCVHLEGGMKAGVYWNFAEHDTAMAAVPFPGLVIVDDQDDKVAFQGEVEFAGVCALTDVWNFRLGYQFMWMEGVALAPDQISAINLGTNTGINTAGSPFYHGALVQLEGRY